MQFKHLLRLLWNFYINDASVVKVAQWCLSKRLFRYPEVCFITIQYWFVRFSTDFCYPQFVRKINIIMPYLRMECLMTLNSLYPSWDIYHYMDALKLPKDTVKWYLHNLGNKNSDLLW
ncbi:hypothetical protein M0802_014177 [Mischocyttarus mexicanus]|nr:hypothetical protein M0802_014177 [Mischocyttarus mexicanus]